LLIKLKNYLLKKNPIVFIDNESDLIETLEELSLEKIIGIDTEFDWRNTYYPNLSLIQISSNKKIFLIDCLKLNCLLKLKKIFENKKIIKVFHSARSDITVLSCCSDLNFSNCFDIQITEKFLSNEGLKSYAKIVSKYLSLKIDKSETNSNWMRRPFSKSQINYAANDVRFLIQIYKKQKKILEKKCAFSTVRDLVKKEVSLGSQKLHIPRLKKLKFNKKIEKDLFMWRENWAIKKNVPPSYIFKDKHFKKILKIYDENIPKDGIYEILKNEKLAKNLIESLK
tara:strand:- start:516 stop:1364 length:849 start_codon:yes stop_codon:yes gene_type:complete